MSNAECAAIKQPNGCKQVLTIAQFIALVKTQPGGYDFGVVITPQGEISVANEISQCEQQ